MKTYSSRRKLKIFTNFHILPGSRIPTPKNCGDWESHEKSPESTSLQFYPSDESLSSVKKIKFSTVKTDSYRYNLLHSGSSTSSHTIRLYSLLSFGHSSASSMVSPLTFKHPFTLSIYLAPCHPPRPLNIYISLLLTSLPPKN